MSKSPVKVKTPGLQKGDWHKGNRRKSNELNSLLSGVSVLQKPMPAFFTVLFNNLQISVSFPFKMFSEV